MKSVDILKVEWLRGQYRLEIPETDARVCGYQRELELLADFEEGDRYRRRHTLEATSVSIERLRSRLGLNVPLPALRLPICTRA